MTIYDIQNAQKTPIWKQRIIECRSSGLSVKEWCKERGLDFTTYYHWERKILTSIIPAEDVPGLPGPNLPSVTPAQNTAVHMYFSVKPISVKASLSCQAFVGFGLIVSVYQRHDQSFRAVQQDTIPMIAGAGMRIVSVPITRASMPSERDKPVGIVRRDEPCVT